LNASKVLARKALVSIKAAWSSFVYMS
jgi:hypothetical protein